MSESFTYDVFLSHNAKDKEVVRAMAEWLQADGLKVMVCDKDTPPKESFKGGS